MALVVLLSAACSSSSTEPGSPSELPPTAPVANSTGTPATQDGESRSPTASPTETSAAAESESPTVAPASASPTSGPESPTTAPASASPTSGPDAQTPEPAEDSLDLVDSATELMRATLVGNVVEIADKMAATGNRSFIPVLMEMMRFVPTNDPRFCLECSMNILLEGPDQVDVPPERLNWGWWVEWLGNHPEVQAPVGFAGWKGELYSVIDPNFKKFLYDGVKSRIRLEEVVWGGVKKDGIPDLNQPPAIPAGQATYLQDSDRVFGVSINGEHRAYPLRILNPHEMANDVLGGVPFALAY